MRNVLNEKEFKKLKTFDIGYFTGKSYFDGDEAQNYLIFHSILKYFPLNSTWITKWTAKGYLMKVWKSFLLLIIL